MQIEIAYIVCIQAIRHQSLKMIIIKTNDNSKEFPASDITIIAKYMINIMLGQTVFDSSGEFVPVANRTKFPTIVTSHGDISFKSSVGLVFVPTVANTTRVGIVDELTKAISALDRNYTIDIDGWLKKYHTIDKSYYTSIKAKPSGVPAATERNRNRNRGTVQFIAMNIVADTGDIRQSLSQRFLWIVKAQEQFAFDIDNNDRFGTITHHVTSIWYDSCGVVVPRKGSAFGSEVAASSFAGELRRSPNTYWFNELLMSDFASYKNKTSIRLHLMNTYNNVGLELNQRWTKLSINTRTTKQSVVETSMFNETSLREITSNIYEAGLSTDGNSIIAHQSSANPIVIHITGTKLPKSFEIRSDICTICTAKLYDDNYAIVDKSSVCRMFCALCMHGCKSSLETDAEYIFRVKSPVTAIDIIDNASWISSEKKEVLIDVIKSGIKTAVYTNNEGNKCEVSYIGNKYIVVDSVDTFMFQRFSANVDRKIVSILK